MQVSLEQLAAYAQDFVRALPHLGDRAHLVGLRGELGVGKTTFVQAVAKALGVTHHVTSPTYVIMQNYKTTHPVFTTLVHIDAYRLKPEEASTIGWEEVIQDPHALVLVEWPEQLGAQFPHVPVLTFSVLSDAERDITYAE